METDDVTGTDALLSIPDSPSVALPNRGAVNAERAVIIGPKDSGKTKLLMAIHRACHIQVRGQPSLDFASRNEATHNLIRRSVEIMMGKGRDLGTQRGEDHEFDISEYSERDRERGMPPRETRHFHLKDPPGEALFPSHVGKELQLSKEVVAVIDQGRVASSIVLCVDVSRSQTQIYRHLPRLLGEMVTDQLIPQQHSWVDIGRRILRQPTSYTPWTLPRLACERFLLLLTKADQISDIAFRRLRKAGKYVPPPGFSYFRPIDLAQQIAPIAQARAVLGVEVLNSIKSVLKPGAQLAVGISSAGGFDISGMPFLNKDGRPIGIEAMSGSEILRRWLPFGVREAMLFAAFGAYSPTVQRVTVEHLRSEPACDVRIATA